MAGEAALGAIGGATPFGWAGLAASLMGGAARPAGPSSADAMFGGGMFAVDSSNWMINFGDGATQGMTAGDKQGPTMSNPQVYDKPQTAYNIPMQGTGSAGGGGVAYPPANPAAQAQAGGIPILWIVLGLGAILLWKKS